MYPDDRLAFHMIAVAMKDAGSENGHWFLVDRLIQTTGTRDVLDG